MVELALSSKVANYQFGWKTIEDLHGREVKRIKCGQVTRVPKLKESHIVRDSWTRLNVLPSKVMQVSYNFLFIIKMISMRSNSRMKS